MTHTYKFNPYDRAYEAGYFEPDGTWRPLSQHETEEEAIDRVSRLNGSQTVVEGPPVKLLADALNAEMAARCNQLKTELQAKEEDCEEIKGKYDVVRGYLIEISKLFVAAKVHGVACGNPEGWKEFRAKMNDIAILTQGGEG